MKRPLRHQILHERLDTLVSTFDISTIAPDPLQLVLPYDDPRDQEVGGEQPIFFFASVVDHLQQPRV